MIGQRFTRLTVLADLGVFGYGRHRATFWLVRCDCGQVRSCGASAVRRGHIRSCGCLQRDVITKHAHSYTLTYRSWGSMLSRCRNPKYPSYARYGGRGIKVDVRWHTFTNFLSDMGEKPQGMSLDRIDNNGHYEPGNCRWATPRQQSNNTQTNRFFSHNGLTQTVSEWARQLGLNRSTLYSRIHKGYPSYLVLSSRSFTGRRSFETMLP